ncbi:hypothetical protein ACJ3XI_11840 [Litorimonas sp. RW-G-Af-16]
MKKLTIAGIAVVLLALLGFVWLVMGASPDNAPTETITIELDAP